MKDLLIGKQEELCIEGNPFIIRFKTLIEEREQNSFFNVLKVIHL